MWTETDRDRRAATPRLGPARHRDPGHRRTDAPLPAAADRHPAPGSVSNADQALRSLAAFLAEQAPEVRVVADIRHHIENFRTWLATRPRPAHRPNHPGHPRPLGTLRMFFVRISDWDWPEAPARVPIIPADSAPTRRHDSTGVGDAAAAALA